MKTIIKLFLVSLWAVATVSIYLLLFHLDWVMVPNVGAEMKPLSIPTGCSYADSLPVELCEKANPVHIPEPTPDTKPQIINWNLPK